MITGRLIRGGALNRWPLDGGSTVLISIFVSRVICVLLWEVLDSAADKYDFRDELLRYFYTSLFIVCVFVCFCQGGLGTTQEMCLSFLPYYPKLNLTRCLSSYQPALKKFQKEHVWVCDIFFRGLLSNEKIVCQNPFSVLRVVKGYPRDAWFKWPILFSANRQFRKLYFVTHDLKVFRDPWRNWIV